METVESFAIREIYRRNLRPATIKSYLDTISHLGLGDVPLESFTAQVFHAALLRVVNANSRRKHIIAVRSIFQDMAWTHDLRVPPPVPRMYDLPSEGTLRFTLALCPSELQGLLMMYAGLRCGEACAVNNRSVKGNLLSIYSQRQDNGLLSEAKTSGQVVIPRWLATRVTSMTNHTITPGQVRESFRRYGIKTGIHLDPHMLRHWYATTMVNHRINPEIARRQMRHSDLKTTLAYYAQVSKTDIETVIGDLFDS